MAHLDPVQAFVSVLPAHSRAANGWRNVRCPVCGDSRTDPRKKRGGFLETPTGGFRFKCFNGGCEANERPIGWEPDRGLGGRPRKLYQLLGGDIRDLPIDLLLRSADSYDGRTLQLTEQTDEQAVTRFPTMPMPEGSVWMDEATDEIMSDPRFSRAVEYLSSRGDLVAFNHRYAWTPNHPHHLIIPYFHHGRVVGWSGRLTDGASGSRFIGQCPSDYTFNQHILETDSRRSMVVLEGIMDAIALGCLAIRNSTMTRKQELLLQLSGKDIIILPDQDDTGYSFVDAAERNGWRVSLPKWDRGVKDVCDAVKRYGMLYTMETIVSSASRNYVKARVGLGLK